MNISGFFRSREWIYIRRLVLIAIVVVLGLRNYGGVFSGWFGASDREHDVVITQSEFRPDLGEAKPAWIIGLKNESSTHTYDRIELEATYKDDSGKVLETDKMVVRQKLTPGEEQLIASTDFKSRPGATNGSLRVVSVSSIKP